MIFNIKIFNFSISMTLYFKQEKTSLNNTPPTGKSSTKFRARKSSEAVACEMLQNTPDGKFKNIKIEKVSTEMLHESFFKNIDLNIY